MQAKSISGGGISIPVQMGDPSDLRRQAGELIKQAKQEFSRDSAKIEVDYQRTGELRERIKILRGIAQAEDRSRAQDFLRAQGVLPQAQAASPRSAAGDAWNFANAMKMSVAGIVGGGAFQTAMSAAQFGRQSEIAGSSNRTAAIGGQLGMLQAAQGVPVVGHLVKLFDELTGLTQNFHAKLMAESYTQQNMVAMAATTRSQRTVMDAEHAQQRYKLQAEFAAKGQEVDFGYKLNSGVNIFSGGMQSLLNVDPKWQQNEATKSYMQLRAVQDAQAKKMDDDIKASKMSIAMEAEVSRLTANMQPMEAERFRLQMSHKIAKVTADPDMIPQMDYSQQIQEAALAKRQKRTTDRAAFSSATEVGANESIVSYKGSTIYASAYRRLRGMQDEVEQAPEEGGYKARARLKAISEARAMMAELGPQAGGLSRATNIGMMGGESRALMLPDQLAREAAMKSTGQFIKGQTGGATFDQKLDASNEYLKKISETLMMLSDNPRGAGLVLMN